MGDEPSFPRAVLLDALGTLVTFAPPAPRLRAELRGRLGLEVSDEVASRAMRAEIAYYRGHHDLGRDAAGLAELRRRCGAVVQEALGPAAAAAPPEAVTQALVAAIHFEPFPEVASTLRALRARGARLVVVSNWDVSLHDVLRRTGLSDLLDGVLTSAEEGVGKPEPEIFRRALRRAGAAPREAVHAGDSVEFDVAGARAAGVTPVLVARDGAAPPAGVRAIRALDGLLALGA